jgi:hypothetical protein
MNDQEVIMHAETPTSNLVVYRQAIEAAGKAIAPPQEMICNGIMCVDLRYLRFLLRCFRESFVSLRLRVCDVGWGSKSV